MNLRNLDHRACVTVRRRKRKVVIIADLKSFPQRKATVVIKFSVSSKHCINEIFLLKEIPYL